MVISTKLFIQRLSTQPKSTMNYHTERIMGYLLQLIVFLCILSTTDGKKTLKMVNLVYRHGARSPIYFYPTDKYQEKDWPGGAGRLTQIGMNMEYELGIFFKERYINTSFLSRPYMHKEVYIRSSDVERCLESAESQLAGLYPPHGYQVWNPRIPWQPVPVHTVPGDKDPLLRSTDTDCPRLQVLSSEKKKSTAYIDKETKSQPLLTTLTNYSGMDVTFKNLWMITDSIIAERTEGWSVPAWVDILWLEMSALQNWAFLYMYRGNNEMGRLLGGPLLGKMIENMKKFSENKSLDTLYKMNMFSGHDTSLLSLAAALDIDIDVPVFASCIIVELYHSNGSGYFVEMYYRNNHLAIPEPLKLTKCAFSCPLSEFIRLTADRVSVDRNKECGMGASNGLFSTYHLEVLLSIFFILSILLLLFILVICVRKRSLFVGMYSGKRDEVQEAGERDRLI